MIEKNINKYFFLLLAILPLSFLIGPYASFVNIIIFDISFIFLLILKKEWSWLKDPTIRIFLILYLYLIFNSFISLNVNMGFLRNFGFFRLIVFFVGVNYFFFKDKNFYKIFIFWSIIVIIVTIDIFIEKIFGTNILGYSGNNHRVVSFFKNEQIVGGFVYAFSLLLAGFYFIKLNNKNNFLKIFTYFMIFIFLLSIIITGERSNSIKAIFSFILLFSLFQKISYKKKLLFFSIFSIFLISIFSNNTYLKDRFTSSILYSSSTFVESFKHNDPNDNPSGNLYAKLYRSGYEVFKNYPLFGVGNKNYRIESCYNKEYQKGIHIMISDYICLTHPHQIYIEFLAEHGLIGTTILLTIFFLLLFRNLKKILINRNYISVGCFCYLIVVFTPILPGGSFFTDYNISLFFINLSLMHATSKEMNIFKITQNNV